MPTPTDDILARDVFAKAYERYSMGYVDPTGVNVLNGWLYLPTPAETVISPVYVVDDEATKRAIEQVPVDVPISDDKCKLDLDGGTEVAAPLQVGRQLDFP